MASMVNEGSLNVKHSDAIHKLVTNIIPVDYKQLTFEGVISHSTPIVFVVP
jgi:hypothetical protein